MKTSTILYLGNLRTQATHVKSGEKVTTDAPPDNQGKGEYFSPTDLTATSLGSCMMTLMGIASQGHSIELGMIKGEIEKVMGTGPRRIVGINVNFYFEKDFNDHDKAIIEKAALTCPVAMSLHPDIHQDVKFHYGVNALI